ncbi:MAG TPA: alpha-L-arabinofuranosidase C-terminal domain-containing protein [Terracidiphilus sp.]|nr:alpha-L-arabinofuranosidase C-terminal domain-containing protein [Terracidiphilus sp.]
MQRRSFLKAAGAAAAGSLVLRRHPALAQQADSHIEVLIDEPIATIAPEVYGHFTEHLGTVIYDGIYVGEDSKIPNQHGLRSALIEKMRLIKAPMVRWPGGCFADSYDWRDGIGPKSKRPRRTNFWTDAYPHQLVDRNIPQVYDPNTFGTADFARFCKLCDAEPYIAANVRSLPPLEFDRWVEYCNSPRGTTTLSEIRAADGFPDPLNVKYWGVGNESWGCGGNFDPEDYAVEYKRWTTWVPSYGVPLRFVASGPNSDEQSWTRGFFNKLCHGQPSHDMHGVWGLSVHHYAWNLSRGKTQDWNEGKGDALQFDAVDWYELARETDRMEHIINDHWTALGEYDLDRKVRLVVDEYGPWYRPGTEFSPEQLLGQQITVRDAVMTAISLDIFNRNADKVGMAACAQLINNLNALFFSQGEKFITTPNFNVFELYAAHQGATSVRTEFSSPEVRYDRDGKQATFWGLKGSASTKDKSLTLTVVNPDVNQPREAEIVLRGAKAASAKARYVTDKDIHAHNTFEDPDHVKTSTAEVKVNGNRLSFNFPAASVSRIAIELA